jgi:hypothetical protein
MEIRSGYLNIQFSRLKADKIVDMRGDVAVLLCKVRACPNASALDPANSQILL